LFVRWLPIKKTGSVRVAVSANVTAALTIDRYSPIEYLYCCQPALPRRGEGEDGWVKSTMGIGLLLLDGIGGSIRVFL